MKKQLLFVLPLCLAFAQLGCNSQPEPTSPAAAPAPTDDASAEEPAPPPPPAPDFSKALADAAAKNNPAPAPVPQEPEPEPEMVKKVASVGAGRKGQGYGGGIVSEPARVYFRARERIMFDIQIPRVMKSYKALDPEGKGPKSHEEFMEKIIKEGGIQLPDLPAGESYQYDPETEDLLVLKPKR